MSVIEKINQLPDSIRLFFNSEKPRIELEKACLLYSIDVELAKEISRPVGMVFIGEFNLKDLPAEISKKMNVPINIATGIAFEINKRIFYKFSDYFKDANNLIEQWSKSKSAPNISEELANNKILEIEPWILESEKEKKQAAEVQKKFVESLFQLPLAQALRNYPELGEQLITSEKISLKSFPQPVRPSVKNWLADYTFTLGYGKRGTVERGRYLFQNPNTQKLKSEERQKLSYIINSFDANTPITISKNTRQIVFPSGVAGMQIAQINTAPAAQSPRAPIAAPSIEKKSEPSSGVRFTYSQKMPSEAGKLQPQRIVPLERDDYQAPRPVDRTQGKNVVNLKDF